MNCIHAVDLSIPSMVKDVVLETFDDRPAVPYFFHMTLQVTGGYLQLSPSDEGKEYCDAFREILRCISSEKTNGFPYSVIQ